MSPESLIILESGARVSSALVLGVFLVVAVRTVVQNLEQRLDFAEQLIGRPAAPLEARH